VAGGGLMLFRRRTPQTFVQRMQAAFWPQSGWLRALRYFAKRVLRLSGSPHAVALGFAAGAFASFTPFIGFHFILSMVLAFAIGGNIIAAAFGTVIGNPLTFPFIWWSTYEIGKRILGIHGGRVHTASLAHGLLHESFASILPVLKPMVIGAIPLGLVSGLLSYAIIRVTVGAYQAARRRRMALRREDRESGAPALNDKTELT
jgi:uncharacterized protein (DUF2062 family)